MIRQLAFILLTGAELVAQVVPAPLPVDRPWNGTSERLIADANDPWQSPAEASGFRTTPPYPEVLAWYRRLADASPDLSYLEVGVTGENRPIIMLVASRGGASTPAALRATGRPTVLVQGGIHSGEIDGSDAGMMLLRDLTVGKRLDLLDRVNLLLIPVLNPDGHARSSPAGRMNQRGPEVTGWRTNARNLNLNRDYAKLDTPEVRAVVEVINEWNPDFYVDVHVTDGSDYQYDITWGWNDLGGWSPSIAAWIRDTLQPRVDNALTAAGHSPGRLVFEMDGRFPGKGLVEWTATPRFSQGYGDARHLPSILVENHSLKPFRRRVLGTYVLLQSLLETVAANRASLRDATRADLSRRPAEVSLDWSYETQNPTVDFPAYETRLRLSPISGEPVVEYLETPKTWKVPLIRQTVPSAVTKPPVAYWIPSEWTEVIDRLVAHGIRLERNREPISREVGMYRLVNPVLATSVFEGHVPLTTDWTALRQSETFPRGSVRVPFDQPLGILAMLLLEPGSPDSLLRWGFFHPILSRTEYAEAYVMEPMAQRMMDENPELRAEFEKALVEDESLRTNPAQRLEWFYRRTPWYDERYLLYPVGREEHDATPSSSD